MFLSIYKSSLNPLNGYWRSIKLGLHVPLQLFRTYMLWTWNSPLVKASRAVFQGGHQKHLLTNKLKLIPSLPDYSQSPGNCFDTSMPKFRNMVIQGAAPFLTWLCQALRRGRSCKMLCAAPRGCACSRLKAPGGEAVPVPASSAHTKGFGSPAPAHSKRHLQLCWGVMPVLETSELVQSNRTNPREVGKLGTVLPAPLQCKPQIFIWSPRDQHSDNEHSQLAITFPLSLSYKTITKRKGATCSFGKY